VAQKRKKRKRISLVPARKKSGWKNWNGVTWRMEWEKCTWTLVTKTMTVIMYAAVMINIQLKYIYH
jgi:hypothetical protein